MCLLLSKRGFLGMIMSCLLIKLLGWRTRCYHPVHHAWPFLVECLQCVFNSVTPALARTLPSTLEFPVGQVNCEHSLWSSRWPRPGPIGVSTLGQVLFKTWCRSSVTVSQTLRCAEVHSRRWHSGGRRSLVGCTGWALSAGRDLGVRVLISGRFVKSSPC